MKRKILSLGIVLAMLVGSFSAALAIPADVVGTPYEESVGRLFDLGVITGYPDGTYGANDNITREEYSVIAIKTKQLEEKASKSKGETVFGDVKANSWSTGYVNVAEAEKLILGMGKVNGVNSFGPKLNLTYEQAVAIILRAIGYESQAAAQGGWPNGYLAVASDIGLLDGINGTKGELATRGMVAKLTYNALEIPNMIKLGSDYIVSGTQGTDKVYLFNDLHMINEAAASGNWGDIDEDTFKLAKIKGVDRNNLVRVQDKLEELADGDNQNWSPKAIEGVVDGLDEEEPVQLIGPVEITYIDSTVIEADGETYTMVTGTVLRNELGIIEFTGGAAIDGKLNIGDTIYDIAMNDDKRISSMKYPASAADKLAAQTVIDEINALDPNSSTYAADVAAARASLGVLSPFTAGTVTTTAAQQRLVTNEDDLLAAEAALAKTASMTLAPVAGPQYGDNPLVITAIQDGSGNLMVGNYDVKVVSNVDGEVYNSTDALVGGALTVQISLPSVGAHTLTVTLDGYNKATTAMISADTTDPVWTSIDAATLNGGNIPIVTTAGAANIISETESGVDTVVITIAGTQYTGIVNPAKTNVNFTGLPTVVAGSNYSISITDMAGNNVNIAAIVQ